MAVFRIKRNKNYTVMSNYHLQDKDDKQTSSFFYVDNHNRLTTELVNKKYIDDNDIQIPYYDNL